MARRRRIAHRKNVRMDSPSPDEILDGAISVRRQDFNRAASLVAWPIFICVAILVVRRNSNRGGAQFVKPARLSHLRNVPSPPRGNRGMFWSSLEIGLGDYSEPRPPCLPIDNVL